MPLSLQMVQILEVQMLGTLWNLKVQKVQAHSLTISAGNANRHQVFKKMGYLPANPSDIKLRVLPSYSFVPMWWSSMVSKW